MFDFNESINEDDTKDIICLREKSIENFWQNSKNVFLPDGANINYSIVHINIRSIFTNFRTLIATIGDELNRVDILVLTEINCAQNDIFKFEIKNFKIYSKSRVDKRGGGIAIFVREVLKVQDLQINFDHTEAVCLKIENDLLLLFLLEKCLKFKIYKLILIILRLSV
jgi:hypothetical protein